MGLFQEGEVIMDYDTAVALSKIFQLEIGTKKCPGDGCVHFPNTNFAMATLIRTSVTQEEMKGEWVLSNPIDEKFFRKQLRTVMNKNLMNELLGKPKEED